MDYANIYKKTQVIWQKLRGLKSKNDNFCLQNCFNGDVARGEDFSVRTLDIHFDFSRQLVDKTIFNMLLQLCQASELENAIKLLFDHKWLNNTENRYVLHPALRSPVAASHLIAGQTQMQSWVNKIRQQQCYLHNEKKPIDTIISLGIGGSHLGVSMASQALEYLKKSSVTVHYVANCDPATLFATLAKCNPATTACLIVSKSFATKETFANAELVRQWYREHGIDTLQHWFAVTSMVAKAQDFGICAEKIFALPIEVGGRFSLWSAASFPLAVEVGLDAIQQLHRGAYALDEHFQDTPLSDNIPVIMALIGIWNINFYNYTSLAVIPYLDQLAKLPSYLQQLEMESNGKLAVNDVNVGLADYATAPVIWGEVGCLGQHAFMQSLHQGTTVVPVDFIVTAKSTCQHYCAQKLHNMLVASCMAQSEALMRGQLLVNSADKTAQALNYARYAPGNRPSSTIMLEKLTPYALGQLLAMYEHKVFVQGVIWQIQSFDQWGVEMGKTLLNKLEGRLMSADLHELHPATAALCRSYQSFMENKTNI